jgi:hypothetical protein
MNKREKAAMSSERDRRLLGWLAVCGVMSVEQMTKPRVQGLRSVRHDPPPAEAFRRRVG